ncbi:MAG: transporter substrate-binding domain-containing protein [Pirellulales bacterium]
MTRMGRFTSTRLQYCQCARRLGIVLGSWAFIFIAVLPLAARDPDSGDRELLKRIANDGNLRIGMYLGFEGLSYRDRGKLVGLEVEVAELITHVIAKELAVPVEPQIVNQEWSQIIKVLRDKKYDVVISAVIPSPLYESYGIRYSSSYLDSGPTICCQEVDGKPREGLTESIASLRGKSIVVINDPAVRSALRSRGIYVEGDENATDLERCFPKSETLRIMGDSDSKELVPVSSIIQLDDMPKIYELIGSGEVDAGVIDLGIIWSVSENSKRWAKKIYAFSEPIAPYIYCAVTRQEDEKLGKAIENAVQTAIHSEEYAQILKKWHGPKVFHWGLSADDFLRSR